MFKINALQTVYYLVAFLFAVKQIQLTAAADTKAAVSFPDQESCQCLIFNCSCCQKVVILGANLNKKICMMFNLNLNPLNIYIKITLDDLTVVEFLINANNPPKYCIPIFILNSVAMCIRMFDIKMVGMSSVQICSSIYVTEKSQEVFTQNLPCVRLGPTGLIMLP